MKTSDRNRGKYKLNRLQKKLSAVVLLFFIALVIAFAAYRVFNRLRPLQLAAQPPLPVETIKLKTAPFSIVRSYTGTIESARRSLISSRLNAQVKEIFYRAGEKVEKGALLIMLDDKELRDEIERLKAMVSSIEADLNYWMLQANRDEKLLEAKAIAPQKRDESRHMVNSLKASLMSDKYALETARTRLQYALIHAPFSGTVQKLFTEEGETAIPGKILLDIVSTRFLKAVFSVPQKDHEEIKVGMDVLVVSYTNKKITGHIDHIYPALDLTTRNATFELIFPQQQQTEGLMPGMAAEAMVTLNRFEQAIVLPASSIRIQKKGRGVYVVENNIAFWRPVTIGKSRDKSVMILSGLKPDETVVTTPDPRLQNGTRVKQRNNWGAGP